MLRGHAEIFRKNGWSTPSNYCHHRTSADSRFRIIRMSLQLLEEEHLSSAQTKSLSSRTSDYCNISSGNVKQRHSMLRENTWSTADF